MLRFSPANTKTSKLNNIPKLQKYLKGRKVYSLDLLSGWSCPGAKDCAAKVYDCASGRKVRKGKDACFRCFSAMNEAARPMVYNLRKRNLQLLRNKNRKEITDLILHSIPEDAGIVRLHVGGDFFNLEYLCGVIQATKILRGILFYGYTKSLHLIARVKGNNLSKGILLPNFRITASVGGQYDYLIPKLNIRTARVVFAEQEAGKLPIDHDDSHAATIGGNFALLLHGSQPANSEASRAWEKIRQAKMRVNNE